jgi:hypothetical protein
MPQVMQLRVANPRRRKTKNFSKRRRVAAKSRKRRNPLLGGGELALMTNPKRKKRNSRRRRGNPFGFSGFTKKRRTSRRRRCNPSGFSKRRRSNRRRNPFVSGVGTMDLLKIGLSAAGGGYGTRALTQLVLQSNNTGWMGYGANFAIAFGLGWAADKFLGKDYGVGVVAGGISATAMRIWSEKVSQTSPAQLSGLGDLDFSSNGMGDYVETSYAIPSTSTKNAAGQYIINNPWPAPPALPATTAAKASGKGMGRVAPKRFVTRWA